MNMQIDEYANLPRAGLTSMGSWVNKWILNKKKTQAGDFLAPSPPVPPAPALRVPMRAASQVCMLEGRRKWAAEPGQAGAWGRPGAGFVSAIPVATAAGPAGGVT